MRINLSFINVYKKKSTKSKIVTQLLYGDTFKKLKKTGSWIRIKNDTDNYRGYIKNKNFPHLIIKILIKFIVCIAHTLFCNHKKNLKLKKNLVLDQK